MCWSRTATGSPPANVMCPASNSRPTASPVRLIRAIDVGRRFHIRAHVMVIRDAHAVRQRVLRDLVEPFLRIRSACIGEEARALIERLRRALDRVGHFAIDHHGCAILREQVEVRSHRRDLVFHTALREPPGIPAGRQVRGRVGRAASSMPAARAGTCCPARSPHSRSSCPRSSALQAVSRHRERAGRRSSMKAD